MFQWTESRAREFKAFDVKDETGRTVIRLINPDHIVSIDYVASTPSSEVTLIMRTVDGQTHHVIDVNEAVQQQLDEEVRKLRV